MRREWCAAAMVTCAAMLGSSAPARGQAIGEAFSVSGGEGFIGDRSVIGMAGDGSFVVAWEGRQYPPRRIWARRFDAAAQPLGPFFQVNAPTPFAQSKPAVAVAPDGEFTVVWTTHGYPLGWQVRGQRFDTAGTRLGQEFAANTVTSNSQTDAAVAVDVAGNTVVAWTRGFGFSQPTSTGARVVARRFDAGGTPLGGEFRVNTYTSGHQLVPSVAFQDDGGFVVAWHGTNQDGSAEGVFAQRYAASGTPVGGEFPVNTYTTGIQAFTCMGPAGNGGFVIGWVSSDGADDAGAGVFARQFDAAGSPLGPEFRVSDTLVHFAHHACSVSTEGAGGFAIAWAGGLDRQAGGGQAYIRRYDATGTAIGPAIRAHSPNFNIITGVSSAGNGAGRLVLAWSERDYYLLHQEVIGQRFGAAWPVALAVDESPSASDGNGVLDPGEAVVVAPTWHNTAASDLALTAQVSGITGPGMLIVDGQADYGTLPAGAARGCADTGDCYVLGIIAPEPRLTQHLDATFVEALGNQQSRTWTLHIGGSFDDVPRLEPSYLFTETLFHHGVTGGCSATGFCPGAAATREQMAVFLLAAKMGRTYSAPRPATGVFTDVLVTSPFASWIEDLWNREIVTGCDVDRYCPGAAVTRAQMAVMLLRTVEGPSYVPPACTTPVFADVPCSDPFARWINELAARGITGGCGAGLYCPASPVTRGQMSVFLSRGFGLELYGAGDVR